MSEWFGASWETIGFVMASTVAIYASAFIGLRVAGRRTLSQMSSFDFLITVALGTLVSSTAVSENPSYLQGVTALATFLLIQVTVAALRQRFTWLQRYLDFRPAVLVQGDELILRRSPMTAQVTRDELMSKLRQESVFDLEDVRLVILEPNGKLSIVRRDDSEGIALDSVKRRSPDAGGQLG